MTSAAKNPIQTSDLADDTILGFKSLVCSYTASEQNNASSKCSEEKIPSCNFTQRPATTQATDLSFGYEVLYCFCPHPPFFGNLNNCTLRPWFSKGLRRLLVSKSGTQHLRNGEIQHIYVNTILMDSANLIFSV